MKTKFSSKKLMASILVAILSLSIVGANIFGDLNAELYNGYIQGNTILGETQTLTDPSVRDKYNDLIFVTGKPGFGERLRFVLHLPLHHGCLWLSVWLR